MSFSSPWFLLALLIVPAAAGFARWVDRRRTRYAVAFTNLELLAAVAPARRRPLRFVPLALFLLALAVAATALARPQTTVSKPAERATIVLLVDVSGSMRAADVRPTRLGAAQRAMDLFADRVPQSMKLGLVSFSTEPDVLVAPTTDRTILHEGIQLLVPDAGTAIGDGVAVAVQVVKASLEGAPRAKDGTVPGAIVLLSDGAQTRGVLTPLEGARRARAAGIRVFTVALGTDHGTLGIGPFGGGYGFGGGLGNGGRRINVLPDPVTLAAIAHETGGRTYRAGTAAQVQEVYKELGSSIVRHHVKREVSSWFAGLAAMLLLGSVGTGRVLGERLP